MKYTFVVFFVFYLIQLHSGQLLGSDDGEECITTQGKRGRCQNKDKPCDTITNKNDIEVCSLGWIGYTFCCPNDKNPPKQPSKPSIACGKSPALKQHFIINGKEAIPNAFPWLIGLYQTDPRTDRSQYICGGAVINQNYVLTAAHCVVRGRSALPANNFKVRLGAHKLSKSGDLFSVSKVIYHSRYDENHHKYDIALLKLNPPINWQANQNVKPLCLPPPELDNANLVGQHAIVAGWGTTNANNPRPSETLYYVEVPIIKTEDCARSYQMLLSRDDQIGSSHICAGYKEGGKDSCQGDSGGALFMPYNGSFTQIGIVSFGKGCAEKNYPGVYTKLTKYTGWIADNMV